MYIQRNFFNEQQSKKHMITLKCVCIYIYMYIYECKHAWCFRKVGMAFNVVCHVWGSNSFEVLWPCADWDDINAFTYSILAVCVRDNTRLEMMVIASKFWVRESWAGRIVIQVKDWVLCSLCSGANGGNRLLLVPYRLAVLC